MNTHPAHRSTTLASHLYTSAHYCRLNEKENKFCMDWKKWKFSITCDKCAGSGHIKVNTMPDQKLGEQCSKCEGKGICTEKMPQLADRLCRSLISKGFFHNYTVQHHMQYDLHFTFFIDSHVTFLHVSADTHSGCKLIAQNPVESARLFKLIVDAFHEHLIGLKVNNTKGTSRDRKKGIFGFARACYGIVEADGKGNLHLHEYFYFHCWRHEVRYVCYIHHRLLFVSLRIVLCVPQTRDAIHNYTSVRNSSILFRKPQKWKYVFTELTPYLISRWAHKLADKICEVIDSYVSATIHTSNIPKTPNDPQVATRDDPKVPNPRVAFHNPPMQADQVCVDGCEEKGCPTSKTQQDDAERVASLANFHTGPRNGHTDSCSKGSQYHGKCKICRFAMPRRPMSQTTCQEIEMKQWAKYFCLMYSTKINNHIDVLLLIIAVSNVITNVNSSSLNRLSNTKIFVDCMKQNYPQPCSTVRDPPKQDETFPLEPFDERCIALDIKRTKDDVRHAEFSPLVSSLLRCNNCASPIGSRSQGKATLFYTSPYFGLCFFSTS